MALSFLYTTEAGLVDLIFSVLFCGFGLWKGGRDVKFCAVVFLLVFIASRFTLMFPDDGMKALGQSFAELAAMISVLFFTRSLAGKTFAGLYAVNIFLYVMMANSVFDFHLTSNARTVVLAFQLIVISGFSGGGQNGYAGKLAARGHSAAGSGAMRLYSYFHPLLHRNKTK